MNIVGNGILKALSRAFSQFNAFISLKIEDAKVFEGIVFQVRKRFVIAQSGVVDIIIDPTGASDITLVLQPIGFDAIGGPFHVDIYHGATADDDGTLIQPENRLNTLGLNGDVIFKKDPSNIDVSGLTPLELIVPSDGTGAVGTSGSSSNDSIVTEIDITEKCLIRITNTDGTSSGTIGIKTDHFEVPN